ncbi:MAG: DNA-directed RNA polymerase subunit E'' [Candidatus Altarchaeaceae archaeon]
MRACKKCLRIYEEDIPRCLICKSPTTENFTGFFGVINVEKSEIAKLFEEKLKVKIMNGKYALNAK